MIVTPQSDSGSFYYLILKSSGSQPASIVRGPRGLQEVVQDGAAIRRWRALNAMLENGSFILAREHGRVVRWGGSWPMLHGGPGEDGMREEDGWPGAQVGDGSRAPGGKRRGLAGLVGIRKGEEEIHSDRGLHPRDRSPRSPWAR